MHENSRTGAGRGVRIRRVEDGYVAEGPGFYVWDEDRREVVRAASELARGSVGIAPTRRMLQILLDSDLPVGP